MPPRHSDHAASGGYRFLWGLLLLPLALFLLLGLLSYDPGDLSFFKVPPNRPPENLIGPFGVWVAFGLYLLFGGGAYVAPLWCLAMGICMMLRRGQRAWIRGIWLAVALLSISALLDLGGVYDGSVAALNTTDPGGLTGWLVTHGILVRALNKAGTSILLWSLTVLGLLMFVGVGNLARGMRFVWATLAVLLGRVGERIGHVEDRQARIKHEEERLQKQRKKLERQMRWQKRLDQIKRVAHRVEPAPSEKSPPEPPPPAPPPSEAPAPKPPRKPARQAAEATAPDELDSPAVDSIRFPGYKLPGLDLLDPLPAHHDKSVRADTAGIMALLESTLAEFGVQAQATNAEIGPVVTRYEMLPAPGVRVERIAGLANNIALALKATSVRVQAPIPGKGVVGIEVPNETSKLVFVREIIESPAWEHSNARLPLVLGKDVSGKEIVADLTKMPHMLIAGATGSGKSVCINSILVGLLMARTPDELRLLLVDPKIVEFAVYHNLPHLVVPVITDPKKVAISLRWAITEMEFRYKMFAKAKVRNIESYNSRKLVRQEELFATEAGSAAAKTDELPPRVPYIVIVIDELADLMLAAGPDIENAIARLAQLSRAVGIHMIIATQRPSVNVITGTIKANFPARVAFQVAQRVDSRTILDQQGADKLLGRGDMLYLPPSSSKLARAQGSMVNDAEIQRIVEFINAQAEPAYEMEIKNSMDKAELNGGAGPLDDGGEDDELLAQSVQIIRETHRASTSSLQRRLRIGYTRAARVMDILEERGVVGPARGAEPREILIDLDVDVSDSPVEEPEPGLDDETDERLE
jgi:DNA segregation ATPase FtsK/SpoIIIE, S-DNA-T family